MRVWVPIADEYPSMIYGLGCCRGESHSFSGQGSPELYYPFHDRTVIVTSCGRMWMYNNKTNLSVSLAGWAVGLKETTASGWSVLWITISAILIWRRKLCSPCRTPSGRKC